MSNLATFLVFKVAGLYKVGIFSPFWCVIAFSKRPRARRVLAHVRHLLLSLLRRCLTMFERPPEGQRHAWRTARWSCTERTLPPHRLARKVRAPRFACLSTSCPSCFYSTGHLGAPRATRSCSL